MSIKPHEVIACPSCGHLSALWRSTCENCFVSLSTPLSMTSITDAPSHRRPGCVLAYIFLSALAIPFILDIFLNVPPYHHTVIYLCMAVIGVAYNIIVPWGLWNLQNWARISVVAGNSLFLILQILNFLAVISVPYPESIIFSTLAVLGATAYTIYWFASNARYFD